MQPITYGSSETTPYQVDMDKKTEEVVDLVNTHTICILLAMGLMNLGQGLGMAHILTDMCVRQIPTQYAT